MLRHSKSVKLFLDINYGSGLPVFPSTACVSLYPSRHQSRSLPNFAPSDQRTDFRDFSPRFPNHSHAKARFCSLPTCWWSQSWSCTRYQTCKTLLFRTKKKRNSYCFQATNVFSNSMTCSPTKGRELSVDGQRENCIIPPPCLLSSSILYIAFLRFVYVHIIPRPHSFAYSIYI